MYHVSAQGIDERMINVHYYYYFDISSKDDTDILVRACVCEAVWFMCAYTVTCTAYAACKQIQNAQHNNMQ